LPNIHQLALQSENHQSFFISFLFFIVYILYNIFYKKSKKIFYFTTRGIKFATSCLQGKKQILSNSFLSFVLFPTIIVCNGVTIWS
jgi:hypothetical protein